MARGWGWGWERGETEGGGAIRRWIVSVFTPPSVGPPVCQNGLLPAKHAFTAREGLFFVDEKDTPPGLKRNPSIHKVV